MVWAIIVVVLLAGADQLLKLAVKTNIPLDGSVPVIDGFFNLTNRQNTGAAWSFLADKDWGIYFLIASSSIMTIILLAIIWRSTNVKLKACLTVIAAGSAGNLIDRIRDRSVTDYLDFHFGNYIFPTFNLADILVVCGTILLGLLILTDHSLLQSKPKATEPEEDKNAADRTD